MIVARARPGKMPAPLHLTAWRDSDTIELPDWLARDRAEDGK